MGRNKKQELIDAVPDKLESRADRIRYWLQQRDYPSNYNSPEFKAKSTVHDRMILGMIDKAGEGNAAAFNALMEHGWGKNTEGADVSSNDAQVGAGFNVAGSVSKLYEQQKLKQVDLEDSIKEIEKDGEKESK